MDIRDVLDILNSVDALDMQSVGDTQETLVLYALDTPVLFLVGNLVEMYAGNLALALMGTPVVGTQVVSLMDTWVDLVDTPGLALDTLVVNLTDILTPILTGTQMNVLGLFLVDTLGLYPVDTLADVQALARSDT